MERRLTEENITKAIIYWLENNGWVIVCYDFPQSGTGVFLHPNEEHRTERNKGTIVPDIVAYRNEIVLFFENKERFFLSDFAKVQGLIDNDFYSDSINKLLKDYSFKSIYYGVGLADSVNNQKKTLSNCDKINFGVLCKLDKSIEIIYDLFNVLI